MAWASLLAHAAPGMAMRHLPPSARSLPGADKLIDRLNDAQTVESYQKALDLDRRALEE